MSLIRSIAVRKPREYTSTKLMVAGLLVVEPRAEEQVLFVLQLGALEPGRVDHPRKGDARRALHVVVIDAVLVAVALEQVHRVRPRPILKVNATLRKHVLHRLDKLIDEGIKIRC